MGSHFKMNNLFPHINKESNHNFLMCSLLACAPPCLASVLMCICRLQFEICKLSPPPVAMALWVDGSLAPSAESYFDSQFRMFSPCALQLFKTRCRCSCSRDVQHHLKKKKSMGPSGNKPGIRDFCMKLPRKHFVMG